MYSSKSSMKSSQQQTQIAFEIHYEKRKNTELLQKLKDKSLTDLSVTQNYVPLYDRFFKLSEKTSNSINLNHEWYLTDVIKKVHDDDDEDDEDDEVKKQTDEGDFKDHEETSSGGEIYHFSQENLYVCKLSSRTHKKKSEERIVFFKMAPLFDPYKLFCGKLSSASIKMLYDETANVLPSQTFQKETDESESLVDDLIKKFKNTNNSAYVDGFFVYLTSLLLHKMDFKHGLDFFGFFMGMKNNYQVNIYDDYEYLENNPYFKKNCGTLFTVEDEREMDKKSQTSSHDQIHCSDILCQDPSCPGIHDHPAAAAAMNKQKLRLSQTSCRSELSMSSIDNDIFEDIFKDEEKDLDVEDVKTSEDEPLNVDDVSDEISLEEFDVAPQLKLQIVDECCVTVPLKLKSSFGSEDSNSTCSSRSSHTNNDEEDDVDDVNVNEDEKENDDDEDEKPSDEEEEEDEVDEEEEEEETMIATIPKFPVLVVCMEQCKNTLDDLLSRKCLKDTEIIAALMQVIMILITYQKVFHMTHNDLHTNNIMFNETTEEYLFYQVNGELFRVPTYGRIFKIIDFGRSIYKFHGQLMCSDSFEFGNDASSQYNTEPFFDETKPRVDPNFSFDLCRLGCSLFDYIIDDPIKLYKKFDKCKKLHQLVFRWCLNDKDVNVLYKSNGDERYPNFKLYKMIARTVHHLVPVDELKQDIFRLFVVEAPKEPFKVFQIDSLIPAF